MINTVGGFRKIKYSGNFLLIKEFRQVIYHHHQYYFYSLDFSLSSSAGLYYWSSAGPVPSDISTTFLSILVNQVEQRTVLYLSTRGIGVIPNGNIWWWA